MNWGEPYKGSLRNLQLPTVSPAFAELPREMLSGAGTPGAQSDEQPEERRGPHHGFPPWALSSAERQTSR